MQPQEAAALACVAPEDNPYIFASLIMLSSRFSFVIDAALILEHTNAPSWSKNDTRKMRQRSSDFLSWLTETGVGVTTLAAFNDHGVYAHVMSIGLGFYSAHESIASEFFYNATLRIDDGIAANESQPHELIRSQPFHYSMFTLVGFLRIIAISERCTDLDLWNHEGPDRQSVKKAIEFLIPAALNINASWPYREDVHFERAGANELLHFAVERGSKKALNALTSYKSQEPSLRDRWPIRPAPQQLENAHFVRP